MRLKLSLLSLSVYLAMTVAVHAAMPAPSIDLDFSTLPLGDVVQLVNPSTCDSGLANKKFVAVGQPPTCQVVDGKRAITFSGVNGFISQPDSTDTPWSMGPDFTGAAPYTVSYTVFNPSISGMELVFMMTKRAGPDFTDAAFGYGNQDSYGAVNHWGTENDMAFDRGVPPTGIWHNITVTYSGVTGWEKVYVDGVINAIEKKIPSDINNITAGDPVYIGITDDTSKDNNFTGSLAALKVYKQEATTDEVLLLNGNIPAQTIAKMPNVPTLVNPSFELVQGDIWVVPSTSTSNNKIESRTIPGWAYAPYNEYVNGSARRGGIAINVANRGQVVGGGFYDNGLTWDGTRVLALVGQATEGRAVSQYAYLKSGRTYHVKVYYNAASTGAAMMNISVNYNNLPNMPVSVTPVESQWSWTVPFYLYEGDFSVATSGCYPIKIENQSLGAENVLLVDKIELYESNPNPPIGGLPKLIDFGYVQKSSSKNYTLHIQNMGANNLDIVYYTRTGTDSGQVDFTDNPKPGTTGSTPNYSIENYQTLDLHLKFSATTAVKTYTGNVAIRYRNGNYGGDYYIPWTATVPASPAITNAGFEVPYNANEQYSGTAWYNNYGGNVMIPGWFDTQTSQGLGVADRGNGQFVNYGNVPEGRQALWIQTMAPDGMANNYYGGKSRSVSQLVPGFVANRAYKIIMYVNARSNGNNQAFFQFKINDQVVTPVSYPGGTANVTMNGIANVIRIDRQSGNWCKLEYNFTQGAADGANKLELCAVYDTRGECVLNVDYIKIYDTTSARSSRVGNGTGAGYGVPYPNPTNIGTSTKNIAYNVAGGVPNYTFYIYNEGGTTLTLTNLALTGQNAKNFRLNTNNGTYNVLTGANLGINVQLTPREVGGFVDAFLQFNTNDTTGTIKIPLAGTGYDIPTVLNKDFSQPVCYWDDAGTIWRSLGTNMQPANWSRSSGILNGVTPNYGANATGVDDRIAVAVPLNSTYQGSFHVDNGYSGGKQVCWIQTSTSGGTGSINWPKGIYQTVQGFQAGVTYHAKALLNARAVNDKIVKGVVFHYKAPGSSTWVDVAPPTDIESVDPQFTYATPYRAMEGDFVAPLTGGYVFELWMPQQDKDQSLLVQSITVEGPTPPAVKHWSMFE